MSLLSLKASNDVYFIHKWPLMPTLIAVQYLITILMTILLITLIAIYLIYLTEF